MNAAPPTNCATGPSGLGNDDRSGITAIYDGIASGAAPPATPTAFSATSSLSTVTMAWTPASTGGAAQRFLIDAGQAPGNYNLGTITVNAPAVSTSVPGAPPGTYYVRVRAQNVLGTSAPSAERSVTVGACTPPGAPATFTATSDNQNVNLQWTAPTSGVVQGYQVIAGTTSGASNLAVLPFAASVTSLTGSVPFGRYFVRVLATNVCGAGPASPELILNVQPCTGAPSSPTGLSASVTAGVVTLTWNAPAGTAPTGYTLIAGRAPGAADVLVYPTGSTATSLVAPAPRGTYYVRVAASNACGVSGQSNEFVVVVP
jgi:predicted phage tail protein